MTQEAATPPGFWERVQQAADRAAAAAMRSGPLRNASISDGGLTIKGGFLKLVSKAIGGVNIFYVGPSGGVLGDGNIQQIMSMRRADGSTVLSLYDAFPGGDGTLNQALNWWDRHGHVVLADDTDSGQGMARPWLSGQFARRRYEDMSVQTTSASFETLWDLRLTKQQPRLEVAYRATMDTAATTGETRVLVDGDVLGGITNSESFLLTTRTVGPASFLGDHMEEVLVEIQGRVTSGSGALRVEALHWKGRQS